MNTPLYYVRVHNPESLAAYWTPIILLCDVLQYGEENITIYRRVEGGRIGKLTYEPTTVLAVRKEHEAAEAAEETR